MKDLCFEILSLEYSEIFFKHYVAYKSSLINHVLWMYTMSFCFMTLLSWRPYRSANNVSSLKIHITYLHSKGRLISVRNFGVFKSPKKSTKFYQDFYPIKLGQKPCRNWLAFWEIWRHRNFILRLTDLYYEYLSN